MLAHAGGEWVQGAEGMDHAGIGPILVEKLMVCRGRNGPVAGPNHAMDSLLDPFVPSKSDPECCINDGGPCWVLKGL
jgi:hypothetical protein